MPLIKLTSKRQATFPKSLCDELNIEAGDTLEVVRRVVDGETLWCLQAVQEHSPPWFGSLGAYAAGKSHDLGAIRETLEKTRRDE